MGFIFIAWYENYRISLVIIATHEIFSFIPFDEMNPELNSIKKNLEYLICVIDETFIPSLLYLAYI